MTQKKSRITTPSATVSRRIKELRQKKGWSAAKLAEVCAEYGMPELNRSVIANIESRRRKNVSLEEAATLAYVLDVALLHLMIPIDEDDQYKSDLYRIADGAVSFEIARAWIRGQSPLIGQDPRTYFSEVPLGDDPIPINRPSDEEIQKRSDDVDFYRRQTAKYGFFDRTDGDPDGIDPEEA